IWAVGVLDREVDLSLFLPNSFWNREVLAGFFIMPSREDLFDARLCEDTGLLGSTERELSLFAGVTGGAGEGAFGGARGAGLRGTTSGSGSLITGFTSVLGSTFDSVFGSGAGGLSAVKSSIDLYSLGVEGVEGVSAGFKGSSFSSFGVETPDVGCPGVFLR